jgi:acyl-CoA reductase-like NAD-dependent aldehyde dehydrogenase/ubiquinone/menaquinone biosynthesis C-methylase UbiE
MDTPINIEIENNLQPPRESTDYFVIDAPVNDLLGVLEQDFFYCIIGGAATYFMKPATSQSSVPVLGAALFSILDTEYLTALAQSGIKLKTDVPVKMVRLRKQSMEAMQQQADLIRKQNEQLSSLLTQVASSVPIACYEPTVEVMDKLVDEAKAAQRIIECETEIKLEDLILEIASAIRKDALFYAEQELHQSGMGQLESKLDKLALVCNEATKSLVGIKTYGRQPCGESEKVVDYLSPVGVIFAVIPLTNPIPNSLFKIFNALRTRNSIIISYPKKVRQLGERLVREVQAQLSAAGLPRALVQCLPVESNRNIIAKCMSHKGIDLILATGGAGLVKSAHSSGNPAYGVGPGNVPALVTNSANLIQAASQIVQSKSYDNGIICGSENNIVVEAAIYENFVLALIQEGAAVISESEREKAIASWFDPDTWKINNALLGVPASHLAKIAGVTRPYPIKLIVLPIAEHEITRLGREKLTAISTLLLSENRGIELCKKVLQVAGEGHSAVIHSYDPVEIDAFAQAIPAGRLLVNVPATSGMMGVSTDLPLSFMVGSGSYGKNITTDNISWKHLVNVKRVAFCKDHENILTTSKDNAVNPLDALNKLNSLAFTFYTAGTFSASCNLKIYDVLTSPKTPGELAQAVNIHPDSAQRLLSAVENLGLVEQTNGRYVNSEAGHYLSESSNHPMAFHQNDCYFYHMWEFLPDALREYSPRHLQAWNQSAQELYKAIYGNEKQMRHFFRLLDSYNWPIGEETARVVDFSEYRKILDVAGGTGTYAATVVKQYPNLSGVCLDLEPVRYLSEEMIAKNNIADKFEFLAGDMFKNEYPRDCDVIFLSYILHNWDETNCLIILKNCFDALPSGGMLLISEKVLNNDYSGDWWGVMMNLQMLIAFQPGAKERTENEYYDLLQKSGFVTPRLYRLDAPRDVLIAFKP